MPNFVNPFNGIAPENKMDEREILRALRLSLSSEEEAIFLYEALADSIDNELAKKVLQEIANEEKVHVGEFQKLISILDKEEDELLEEGEKEVVEKTEKSSKWIQSNCKFSKKS